MILGIAYVAKVIPDVVNCPFGFPLRSEGVPGSALDTLDGVHERGASHVGLPTLLQLIVGFSSR